MFESIPWWRALTIAERLALTRMQTSTNAQRAAERSARWHELAVFHHTNLTPDEAVAPLGLDWQKLNEFLGEEDSSLRARAGETVPWWLDRAERWHSVWSEEQTGFAPDRELYNLVVPLVEGALAELLDRLTTVTTDPLLVSDSFIASLAASMPSASLSAIITPCLVQDMYDQRYRDDGSLRRVPGEGVYRRYVTLLGKDATRERLFAAYPVLLRAVIERLEIWVESRLEFVERLDRDLDAITDVLLAGRRPTTLTVSFDVGDSHRRGRAVAILSTDSGRFVYKPHTPAVEMLFCELCDLVQKTSEGLPLHTALLVPRGDYFWQEFVETVRVTPQTAASMAEQLGVLTALLYSLRSNDFHHENVILGADGPVPIDLESVLHTSQDYRVKQDVEQSNTGATALDDSCLGVGILPHPLVVPGVSPQGIAADISVIGYTPGAAGGVQMPHLVNMGTADMRIEYERAVFDSNEGATGRELLHSQQDAFEKGFREGYTAVMRTSRRVLDAVLGADGAASRYIARPTMIYGKILAESYHPAFMADALDRHLVLGKLLAHFVGRTHRNALIAAEMADMLVGDIPVFSLDLTTGALRASNDTTVVGTLTPPTRRLAEVLATMGREHLLLQEHVIRLAFGCLPDARSQGDPRLASGPSGGCLDDDKLEVAAALIERIEGLVVDGGRLGTLTLSASAPHQWTVTPGGIDLYSGSTGVGLAALGVAELTGSARAAEIARAALASAPYLGSLVSNDEEAVRKNVRDLNTGAYGQVAGIALLTAAAHRVTPHPAVQEACRATVQMLGQMGVADRFHDIISGNAGGILAVVSVRDVIGEQETVRTVRLLADHLLATAVSDDIGLSWEQADDGARLVGFSHGAGGVAHALTVASNILGDTALADAAALARAWESVRVTSDGDWPDLRPEALANGGGTMRAWCHGSPGAGYARALLLASHPDEMTPALYSELRAARTTTQETLDALIARTGDLGNDSLCHGTVGNLLCLEAMWEALSDRDEARTRTAPYWEYLLRRGGPWRSGARNGVVIPDLMMGLSGIAWGLAFSARTVPLLDLMCLEVR